MKKILCLILLSVMLFTLTYAEESKAYNLEIKIGNNGTIYVDKLLSLDITVTNINSDFDGYVKVFIPLESNSQEKKYYSYDYTIQIAAGESKKIETFESIDSKLESGNAIVKLVDKSGKVKYEENYKIRKSYDIKTSVGILSEDFDSLNYIQSTKTYELINLYDLNLEIENAFSVYDVVFINFYETEMLSDRIVRSLENYVSNGGQLVIGTGQYLDMSLKKLDFIGDVSIADTEEISSLELQNITGIELMDDSIIKIADVDAGSYKEINSLILKKNIARGSVVISKISLGEDIFTGYFGSDKFVNEFVDFKVDRLDEKYNFRNDSSYSINNYISKIPKKFMPNPWLIIVFIIIFVLLVGPVTYIILNEIDKRDYGFIIIICIVLISIVGIKSYGYLLNSNSDIVNHLSLLSAEGDSLKVESYIGYKGSKGDVDIAFDRDYDISRFVQNNYNTSSGHIYSKYSDEYNHIVFNDSKQWQFNKIKIDSREKFDPNLVSAIKVDGNKLEFEFKNDLDYDIDEIFLAYGNRLFYKSGISKGQSFNFDKDISSMYTASGPNVAESMYGYNSVLGLDEEYLKSDIVRGFFNSMQKSSGAFLLLATDEYSVQIKGDSSKKEQKLAYIYIPLEVEFKKNKGVQVSSSLIKESVLESSGIEKNNYNGYYNGNGFITFEYKIPSTLELKGFEFSMSTSINNMSYEIYNTRAGIWEKLDSLNFIVTDDKVKNYSDDSIKIRVTSTDYVDFESPNFKFEGVGK